MSRFVQSVRRFGSVAGAAPQKTALYNYHVENNGKIVDFCGWSLPIQYKQTIIESHLHTRAKASLFDVSHMGQVRVHGADRAELLERLTVGDIRGLQNQEARLTVMTNEKGGVIDDLIVTCNEKYFSVVVNAGCCEKDLAHIQAVAADFRAKGKDVTVEFLKDQALVALQGPAAAAHLQKFVEGFDLKQLPFMNSKTISVAGHSDNVWITRCGYTGEDGFEISAPSDKIEAVVRAIVEDQSTVKLAGLGARDSLRLEAGLCLYGNDLDETITPVEAGLAWTIPKRRRQIVDGEVSFFGAEKIVAQLNNQKSVPKRRVGFTVTSGAPARQHATLHVVLPTGENKHIGEVTSGTFSPTLTKPISMGYINATADELKAWQSTEGVKFEAEARGRRSGLEITKMPFVPSRYYKL